MGREALPLTAWGLDGADVAPLPGGTANRNYLVEKEGRRYVLRQRSPRYVDPAQITFDHALMRHLADRGIPGPNPLPTVDGDTVVHRGPDVFELHAYLAGRSVKWYDLDDLRGAATALRRFHEATVDFQPPIQKSWPREDDPSDIREGLAELRTVVRDPTGCDVLDTLDQWAVRIAKALPTNRFRALPNQIVHGDFHPGNVSILDDPPGALGLFDLDCASRQPRARDLADGILYFCARRKGRFDASTITRLTRECWLEPERNQFFLDAYGPISEEELAALPWLVAARWIYSRVRGRIKLPREQWRDYVVTGVLTPLYQLEECGVL